MTDAEQNTRARTAFRWVGVFIPLAILLTAGVVALAWLPEMPDPSAVHWSGDKADGFGPPWVNVLPNVIGIVIVIVFAWLVRVLPRLTPAPGPAAIAHTPTSPSIMARFMGAVNLSISALLAMSSLASMHVQRGLADAADAPNIGGWVAIGSAIALVLGVVGWLVQPKGVDAVASGSAPADLALLPGERVAWFGSVAMARAGQITLGIGLAVTAALTVFLVARAPQDDSWPAAWVMVAVTVLLLLLVLTGLVFRVRVDVEGLQVRSLIGWPRTQIALADIARVQVVDVDPFHEFGGWGWRIAVDGRRGIVMRRGRALQVTRNRGSVFVVTVEGADEAAAVLESLRRNLHATG